jgi:uncharacterized protein
MICPKCGGWMNTQNRSGMGVEVCQQCGGLYLDYGELEWLKQREGNLPMVQQVMGPGGPQGPPPDAAEEAMLHCPKCGSTMRTYKRSGVAIEQCDHCRGVFLDHGEIEMIKQREPAAPQQGWAGHYPYQHHGYYGHHPYYYRTGWELLLL